MDAVSDLLRSYEDEVLVPLVEATGIEPVRSDIDFALIPGTTVVLMNNANSFSYAGDAIHWQPLSVIFTDHKGNSGTVYSLDASFNPRMEAVSFQRAEMHGIVVLLRREDRVVWCDPNTDKVLLSFPLEEADKILMNSWYLFSGAVLPMLRSETYRFVSGRERVAFQATMIRHINELYKGTV